MIVHEVMLWTNTSDAATEEIYKSIAEACKGQIELSSILESIEPKVAEIFKAWSAIGDLHANWQPALTF